MNRVKDYYLERGDSSVGSFGQKNTLMSRTGYWLLVLFPLVSLFNIFSITKIGDLSIRPIDCLFILLMFVFMLRMIESIRNRKRVVFYFALLLCFISMTLMGLLISQNHVVAWPNYFRFIETILWGGFALTFIHSREQLSVVERNLIAVGVLMSIISVALYLVDPMLHRIAGYVTFAGGEGMETQASFNEWGALYSLIIGIILWRLYYNGISIWNMTVLIIVAIGLILVQSRSAFLAVICIVFLLFVKDVDRMLKAKIRKKSLTFFLIVIFTITIGIVFSRNVALNRISETFELDSSANRSMEVRFELWNNGLKLLTAETTHFFIGYGNKTFVTATTDNFYLDHALAEGTLGLLFLLSLILMPAIIICKTRRIRSKEKVIVLIVTTVAMTVSITGNVLVDPFYGGITFLLLYGNLSVYDQKDA